MDIVDFNMFQVHSIAKSRNVTAQAHSFSLSWITSRMNDSLFSVSAVDVDEPRYF